MVNTLKYAALAIPITIMAICSAPSGAQETETLKKAERFSPTGTWNWERKSDEDTVKCKLVVSKKKDGTFTGKFEDEDHKLDIKNAKLEKGNFSFELSPHPEQPDKVIQFSGKLTADSIKGNMSYAVGDEKKSTEWLAARFDPLKPAIGKWELEFETPGGEQLLFTINVKKKGDRLTLDFVDDEPEAKISKVKFKKNTLSFDTKQVYQTQPITVEWDLDIDGDSIDGVLFYAFDSGEDEGEIEVLGQKIK